MKVCDFRSLLLRVSEYRKIPQKHSFSDRCVCENIDQPVEEINKPRCESRFQLPKNFFSRLNFREFKMESPIETLSDDALLEIFEYLDPKSLKNASLVCKK